VYCPKKRMVAIASKDTGTHTPPDRANCRVTCMSLSQKPGFSQESFNSADTESARIYPDPMQSNLFFRFGKITHTY